MKRPAVVIIFLVHFVVFRGAGQNPLVKIWDHRYGGTRGDQVYSIEHTSDGGYMFAGSSMSGADGDKTEPNWDNSGYTTDYWLVKTDANGIKEWDKRFGGDSYDFLYSCRQTADGGYILAGYSHSDSTGDKTEPSRGHYDFWLVRTDAAGNKLWDKRYGGSDEEYLFTMEICHDHGFLLGGYSMSDSSGDKTQNSRGAGDFWIVKTDSVGNKQWDRRYGGNRDESIWTLVPTRDGGYILGGPSGSDAGGDKTDGLWDTCSACLIGDYWVVKIDSAGNKEWDKTYGGENQENLFSIIQTHDGGYLLAGSSKSGVGGNKSQPSKGAEDYWVIKIDSLGAIMWDNDYGGWHIEDEIGNISMTSDGAYLIPGTSYTPLANGDKSEDNMGLEQFWLLKIDEDGTKIWDKTFKTTGHDEAALALESNGCYTIANSCTGDIGGYKTEPNWDVTQQTWDIWISRFCDTTITTGIDAIANDDVGIEAYPNPFSHQLTVTSNIKQATSVTLFDYTGKIILSEKISSATTTVNTEGIAAGLYFLRVEDGMGVRNYKVVKQQ
jgi:hypothetical protein